jgi:hypothetical protein
VKFPVVPVEAEVPRLATRSWRKVSRSELLPDVLLVLLDVLFVLLGELLPEAALSTETRLLKSDCSVLRLLSVEEVEEVDAPSEPASNCEISSSSLLEKLE